MHQLNQLELQKDKPSMPKKFQPAKLNKEPEVEFQIRKQRAINDFKSEVKLLEAGMKRFQIEYKSTDEEMIKFIKETFKDANGNKLNEYRNGR